MSHAKIRIRIYIEHEEILTNHFEITSILNEMTIPSINLSHMYNFGSLTIKLLHTVVSWLQFAVYVLHNIIQFNVINILNWQ